MGAWPGPGVEKRPGHLLFSRFVRYLRDYTHECPDWGCARVPVVEQGTADGHPPLRRHVGTDLSEQMLRLGGETPCPSSQGKW